MSNSTCMLCKNSITDPKYNIDEDHTKFSELLLRTFLEKLTKEAIITSNVQVCVRCYQLINDLDYAEINCENIRKQLLGCLDCAKHEKSTANVYCQTDVLLENIVNYDIKGNKKVNDLTAHCYPCGKCSRSFNSDSELKEHIKEHIPVKQFQCHVCSKKFISKTGIALHLKRIHQLNSKGSPVTKDTENNTNNDDTNCNNDENSTTNSSQVTEDEPQVGTLEIDSFKLETDSLGSDTSGVESKSEETSTKKRGRKKKVPDVLKPYKCMDCSKTWKTLGELKSHISTHSDARPFICEICGQAYKHKAALNVHVGMHNGINPYMCSYCKKSFTQKGALQRHLPLHTGETPFQCDLCGKRFVHHTSFSVHQLSHTGQKDFKCKLCGLALLSKSHLKRHTRVHTGERNFACPTCGKRFAERYNLVSHQKLHDSPATNRTDKKNHRCQVCGNTFDRRIKLEEHMSTEHHRFIGSDLQKIQQFLKSDFEPLWMHSEISNADFKPDLPQLY